MNKLIIATAAAALTLPMASPLMAQSDQNEGGYHYKTALAAISSYIDDPRTLDPDYSKRRQVYSELMSALADEPRNGNVHYWIGNAWESAPDKATEFYNTALLFLKPGENSLYAKCATALASHMLNAGQTQKAQELMAKVAKSKCADRNLLIGNYCMDSRVADYPKAAKCYRSAIADSKSASPSELDDLYARLIVAQTLAADISAAQSTIAEAQAKAPSGLLWRQAQSYFLLRTGNRKEALNTILRVCDSDPGKADYMVVFDRMLLIEQITECADADLAATIRNFKPSNGWASISLLVNYALSHNFPADQVAFCQEHASEFEDLSSLAYAYERLFINAKALALNLEKSGEKNHNALAYLRAKMGDIDGATADMDTLVMQKRADSFAYVSYANLLSTYTDRYDDALAYADTALVLDPKNEHALFSRLWALRVVRGDASAARDAANRLLSAINDHEALSAEADDGTHMKSDGDIFLFNSALIKEKKRVSALKPWAYLALGDKDKAIAAVNDMLNPDNDLGENNAPMYRQLFAAEIYALLGMPAEAVTHMTKAMESGYRDFAFLDHTPNLASLRTNRDFTALMEKYRDTYRQDIEKYSK